MNRGSMQIIKMKVDSAPDLSSFKVIKTKSDPSAKKSQTLLPQGKLFTPLFFLLTNLVTVLKKDWVSEFVNLVEGMSLPFGYRDKLIDAVLTEKKAISDIDDKFLLSLGICQLGLRKRILNDFKSLIDMFPNSSHLFPSTDNNNNNSNQNDDNDFLNPFKNTKKKALDINKDMEDWSNADVIKWLYINAFVDYIDAFISHSIDGVALLSLDDQQLRDMGVTALGHRKKILKMIKLGIRKSPR